MTDARTAGGGEPLGSSSSSLDPLETSAGDIGPQTHAQRRLHSRHWHTRARIIRALGTDPAGRFARRAERMADCCCSPIVWHAPGEKPRLQLQACKDRLCPRCQHERGRQARVRVLEIIRFYNAARLITLTLRSTDEPLAELYARLFDCWRVLRQSPWWKAKVQAGVYAVEVTVNRETGSWHPHLHIIYEGDYIDQRELSRVWRDITLDSPIVDIRAVHNRAGAARYVADYIAKPAELGEWTDEQIREFAEALRGKRLVHTFGKSHGKVVDTEEADEPTPPHQWIGPLSIARDIIEEGGDDAAWLTEYLQLAGPRWQDAAGITRLPRLANPRGLTPDDHDHFAALLLGRQGQRSLQAPARRDAESPTVSRDPPLFERWNV
jgi:hypothetical protein